MNWSQKIYHNDNLLVLTTDSAAYLERETAAYNQYYGATAANLEKALEDLEQDETRGVIISDPSEKALWACLETVYQPIDAAGGVAYNEQGEILMIYRRGKWDLPKGKRDKGETMNECALREVKEETGLKKLELADKITDTYHIYSQYGEHLLKRTAWYKMKGTVTDRLEPQEAENIAEVRWIKEQDLAPFLAKTYDAVREVLLLAGLRIDD